VAQLVETLGACGGAVGRDAVLQAQQLAAERTEPNAKLTQVLMFC